MWTPEMQRLWDRAMLIARTRGAYGCNFPVEGTTFRPPVEGTMLHDLTFVCTATEEEYAAELQRIRDDMLAWKERVRARGHKRRELITKINLDLSNIKLEI